MIILPSAVAVEEEVQLCEDLATLLMMILMEQFVQVAPQQNVSKIGQLFS